MILATTNTLDGQPVQQYLGIVAGEAILGANVMKDLGAMVRDLVGGRAGAYEKELVKAREIAMSELVQQAEQLGANAVIGIDVDYETLGSGGSMLMVAVSGTAIKV